ncbi:ATPase [Methanobacterium aggregans]|uniref:ATPase n=1 Tax=Methanobacterium aggregans TaxID=1615586 RepID=UPI001AE45427|nr:ATPase [Methanobacterium aggregans]MBP2046613.1 hypothetical protein [Methanobacterium aggregans]
MSIEKAEFLHRIGVDTRFVSIMDGHVFINNLKFSRFSRRKEELFLGKFPDEHVVRSKIFQKICTRASRNLKTSLNPNDKIFILDNEAENVVEKNCFKYALLTVLEPYKRKYGIEFIFGSSLKDSEGSGADSIALPVTLDAESIKIVDIILMGGRICSPSSKGSFQNMKLIYPLLNVPDSWIISWLEKQDLSCRFQHETTEFNTMEHGTKNENMASNDFSKDLIDFLGDFIPDVRENILKSAEFIQENHI